MEKLLKSLLSIVLVVCASAALAAGEVRFQKVESIVSTKLGQSQQNVRFEANIANLAFNKQVYAHVLRNDGVWVDVPLSYNRSISGNREIWSTTFSPPLNTTYDIRFALKYVVNGQTYWDNNGGQDYRINKDSGTILATGLNVYNGNYAPIVTLTQTGTLVRGYATVKNLAYNKIVRVRYSTDNWATYRTANAGFSSSFWAGSYSSATNPNPYGFEEWSFAMNVGSAATKVEYAIQYVVNGQTYWDNNTGLNYHTNIVRQ